MKFVKLDLTFGEKIKVLFFGLIAEDKLPEKEVVQYITTEKEKPVVIVQSEQSPSINTTEAETLNIPFFELGDDDVKSNF